MIVKMIVFDASSVFGANAEGSRLRRLAACGIVQTLSALRRVVASQRVGATVLAQLLKSADFDISSMVTALGLSLASFRTQRA